MKRASVFIDTSALLALINSDDALHADAVRVRDSLDAADTSLVSSEWVLAELLNHTAARGRKRAGIRAVQAMLASARTVVEPATTEAWNEAFALYRLRTDKDWSLVDCASILICERRGIRRVFTHDRHFAQAGLEVLLR